MAEMQDYNFSNPSDKQAFQRFMIELMRNEINSYTKQTQNNNPNPSASLEAGLLPSGIIVPFAGGPGVTPNPGTIQDTPIGWLLCAGDAVSRGSYSALFAAIGTTYGVGDGSTTFNLPDLRGRAAFGKDDMGGTTASRITSAVSGITGTQLGDSADNQGVTLTAAQSGVPAHTHPLAGTGAGANVGAHTHQTDLNIQVSTNLIGTTGGSNYRVALPSDTTVTPRTSDYLNKTTNVITQTATGSLIGNSAASTAAAATTIHTNVPPAIILNYIIKT